jgi:hypothetical protein
MAAWGERYEIEIPEESRPGRRTSKPIYSTERGDMYCGLSEKVLRSRRLSFHWARRSPDASCDA